MNAKVMLVLSIKTGIMDSFNNDYIQIDIENDIMIPTPLVFTNVNSLL